MNGSKKPVVGSRVDDKNVVHLPLDYSFKTIGSFEGESPVLWLYLLCLATFHRIAKSKAKAEGSARRKGGCFTLHIYALKFNILWDV